MTENFPLPYPNLEALDDVTHAIVLLRVISYEFDGAVEKGLSSEKVSDLYTILSDVMDDLRPVQRFLNGLDYPDMLADYQRARREQIAGGSGL